MKAILRISTIVILLLALVGLFLLFAIRHSNYSGKGSELHFVNASGQQIALARITVANKSCGVKNLGPGGSLDCYFENLHDSSYSVSVTLQNGSVYSEESLGYVTGGMNFKDTITINGSGTITLDSNPST